jgi:hypothetical protein
MASQGVVSEATYGAEKISEGDFATHTKWTEVNGDYMTFDGGKFNVTGPYNNIAVYQTSDNMVSAFEVGKTYKITFTVSGSEESGMRLHFLDYGNSVEFIASAYYVDDTYEIEFTISDVGYNGLRISTFTGTSIGSIDDVSVKERL